MFSFSPLPLYPQRRTPGTYKLNMRLGGPQIIFEPFGKESNFSCFLGMKLRVLGIVVQSLVTIPTLLSGFGLYICFPRRFSRLEQGKIYSFAPKINVFVQLSHVQQNIQKVHEVLPKFILKSEVHRRTAVPHAASASIAFSRNSIS